MATFADDTAVMAIGEIVENSTRMLQSADNKVAIWPRKWRMKLDESKSVHIDLTNKIRQQSIFINGTKVPHADTTKYLIRLLMPRYSGKSILRKNVMSLTSSSGKCIGCLDAILTCQSIIN
jgi:hypothetical protein